MEKLKKNILSLLEAGKINKSDALNLLREANTKNTIDDIAIIGVACKLPMANNPDEYWDNLKNGRNCFVKKPVGKLKYENISKNPHYAELLEISNFKESAENLENIIGAFIDDFDKFDAHFFNIPPREARYMDPGQRVFLETAWSAVEDAGYSLDNFRNTNTGVYVGKDYSNSIYYKLITEPDAMKLTGNWEGLLASRINYIFNLKGPSMVIDTACSSGLVAVHEACNALRNNDCEMAIAGGISMGAGGKDSIPTDHSSDEQDTSVIGSVSSSDNKVRTFDDKSSGAVFGEGVVSFLLKPLKKAMKDGDNVYGVIKGSSINNDGASNGITAPNPSAQEDVIIAAWKNAQVDPTSIQYIEAHGTGTKLGDPIEILGITGAFEQFTDQKQFCGIGSVKSNIGHLVAASGCASLLKIVLSLKNDLLPPTLYFEEPNSNIDFSDTPVYVVDQPSKWERGEIPVRAGVSAFGFSGTNCHLVVEEAEQVVSNKEQRATKQNIITFSAKTKTAMKEIIKRYVSFLEDKTEAVFDDICYTANTGRGHYLYRVAMIVDSLEDLKMKIRRLSEVGLASIESEQIYFGQNKIVSDSRKKINHHEITEKQLSKINWEANQLLNSTKEISLVQLVNLYRSGATINWQKFYATAHYQRVSLPTYPFDRTEYWGEPKVSKVIAENSNKRSAFNHPLIDECLAQSMNEDIYSVHFKVEKHWMLQEHILLSSNIIPGTTYLEICHKLCSEHFNTDQIQFDEVIFLQPLAVGKDESVETHVILRKMKEKISVQVASKQEGDDGTKWLVHMEGAVSVHNGQRSEEFDIQTFMSKEGNESIQIHYPTDKKTTFMGPRWRTIDRVIKNQNCLLSEVQLDKRYTNDLSDYSYHPALTDSALNMPLQLFTNSEMYLPLSYQELKIYQPIPNKFYSYIERVDSGNHSELMKFRAMFINELGTVLAEIKEYTVKKVNKFNHYKANSYYALNWKKLNQLTVDQKELKGPVLIFKDSFSVAENLIQSLKDQMDDVYIVEQGEGFSQINKRHYTVGTTEEDFLSLVSQLQLEKIPTIIHCSSIDFQNRQDALEEYKGKLNTGVYNLLFLAKALTNRRIKGKTDFYLLTSNGHLVTGEEALVDPINGSVTGLAKSLIQEFPNINIRCIDTDQETKPEFLVDEILSGRSLFKVAYRKNHCYQECLESIDVSNNFESKVTVKKEGSYIITGGLGGLGIEMAEYIAMNGTATICLISRSQFPVREEWPVILEKNIEPKLVTKIKKILSIESQGSLVLIRQGNCENKAEMNSILNGLRKDYGKINGIIHSAGVAGDGFLLNKPLEVFNEVINPKVYGTKIVDDLTVEDHLDFFVLFSSMQTIFGGAGQGDYTVANTFLDNYAAHRNMREGELTTHTINWPGWKETGMAADYNVAESMTLFKSMTNNQGIVAMNAILNNKLTNIMPGDLSFEFLAEAYEQLPIDLSSSIRRSLEGYLAKKTNVKSEKDKLFDPTQLLILGKDSNEFTETEKQIATIYASVLVIKEIDIFDSFNSMGGDSIFATEVMKVLNESYNDILVVSDMFAYTCVADMAVYIDSKRQAEIVDAQSENVEDILEQFETGEIDTEDMLDFFETV